jgi:hypothetical protein
VDLAGKHIHTHTDHHHHYVHVAPPPLDHLILPYTQTHTLTQPNNHRALLPRLRFPGPFHPMPACGSRAEAGADRAWLAGGIL